jgi:microcystin degradation protein MlrC
MVLEGTPISVRAAALDAVHLVTWDEIVPAGKCLRIAVGAEGEGTGLLARVIERGTQDEIDRSHADRAVAMRVCATLGAPRAIRIELRASAGKLDAVIGERVTE